jgi:hypothetical protein
MSNIPGHPLTAFVAAAGDEVIPKPANLSTLQDADVILGREVVSRQEFIVFGRETLHWVAKGEEPAEGYNVLCIEVDSQPPGDELELLLKLVESVKGHHEYRRELYG